MGLDITAYKGLKKTDRKVDLNSEQWEEKYEDDKKLQWWHPGVIAFTEEYWPGRSGGIEASTVYTYEEKYEFRAGSYSWYGQFRDSLKTLTFASEFEELINFADNEGVIGAEASKRLHAAFVKSREEYEKRYLEDPYFVQKYSLWTKAFELASDNGAVDFH